MVLWRISRHLDLSGTGGLRADGRWHSEGVPVVYLGDSPACVLLEVCVHTTVQDVPETYTLLRIEGPDIEVSVLPEDALPTDWLGQPGVTQSLGTEWLSRNTGVLLCVPSAIAPYTSNFLFNPRHPLAEEFRIVEAMEYPFDMRIKR
jgi:RES domain-containing protein